MSEPTDQTAEARPSTPGQEVDQLVAQFPDLQAATQSATAALERCQAQERRTLDRLVELLGRPTAARFLGLTPRALAGMLRGAK